MRSCSGPTCSASLGELQARCPECGTKSAPRFQGIGGAELERVVYDTATSRTATFEARFGGEQVALTVFKPEYALSPDEQERLIDEAQELAALDCEFIPKTFGAFTNDEGVLYRAKAWVSASSLADLRARGALDEDHEVLGLLRACARALAGLHAQDLHVPFLQENDILIQETGDAAEPLFVSLNYRAFRFIDRSVETMGSATRALVQEHPDHIAGRSFDARTDVYALGRFFKLVLPDAHERLPAALRELMRDMLAEDPSDRISNGAQVLAALETLSVADFVAARKSAARKAKAHQATAIPRWAVAAVGVAIALALGGTALALWWSGRADDFTEAYAAVDPATFAVMRSDSDDPHCTAVLVDESGLFATNAHCVWMAVNAAAPPDKAKGERLDDVLARGPAGEVKHGLYLVTPGTGARIDVTKFWIHPDYRLGGNGKLSRELASVLETQDKVIGDVARKAFDLPDLALLAVATPPEVTPISIASTERVSGLRKGERVATIGFGSGGGEGRSERSASGELEHVGCLSGKGDCTVYFRHNLATSHGSSGSPIFTRDGELMGLSFAGVFINPDEADSKLRYGARADLLLGLIELAKGE